MNIPAFLQTLINHMDASASIKILNFKDMVSARTYRDMAIKLGRKCNTMGVGKDMLAISPLILGDVNPSVDRLFRMYDSKNYFVTIEETRA